MIVPNESKHSGVMPQLHLPWASYNLFVYDFSGIVDGYKLRCMCLQKKIVCDHHGISFGNRPGQTLQRPYVDSTKTAQSSCSHGVICMTSAQKLNNAPGMSLWVPYHYLNSIQSFLGPYDYLKSCIVLMISVRCPNRDHAIYLQCVYKLGA